SSYTFQVLDQSRDIPLYVDSRRTGHMHQRTDDFLKRKVGAKTVPDYSSSGIKTKKFSCVLDEKNGAIIKVVAAYSRRNRIYARHLVRGWNSPIETGGGE